MDVYNKSAAAHDASLQIWQECFPHVNKRGVLLSMQHKRVVAEVGLSHSSTSHSVKENLSDSCLDRSACHPYVLGRATSATARPTRSTPRSPSPLYLVYSAAWGSMEVQSVGKASYFNSFVYDCTNCDNVHIVQQYSEAFRSFTLFRSQFELHADGPVQVLHTGCGGEYLSSELTASLELGGTQYQLTTVHSPHQNSVAERLNHTLMDLVHGTLADKRACKLLWAAALSTAVHARNKFKSKALKFATTASQLWMDRYPDTSCLRVASSRYWYTIDRSQTMKLDARA